MAAWLLNVDASGDTTASPDSLAIPIGWDDPQADLTATVAPDEGPALAVALDAPQGDVTVTVDCFPDEQPGIGIALDPPTLVGADGLAVDDGVAVTVILDNPAAAFVGLPIGLGDGPAAGIATDAPVVAWTVVVTPDPGTVGAAGDEPAASFVGTATDLGQDALGIALDPPYVGVNLTAGLGDGPGLSVASDPATASMGHFVTPPDTFSVDVTLTAPTFTFQPNDTAATAGGLTVHITPGQPARLGAGDTGLVAPIVPVPTYVAPVLPAHLLGIGPWNTAVEWRGAPNYGVKKGRRASAPLLGLPMADSKSVTLRLNEASEARTSHYFPRQEAVVIEENVTDLWWRRRDPRRNVVDRIGRFNASTVDIDMQPDGGVNVSASYTDYYGLLSERVIMQYLTPGTNPPTTQWAANTLVTDILRWVIPTNMDLDLTGIQAATPDITAKIKHAYELPLGTRIDEVMEGLAAISDKKWEWWVEMPVSDLDRPRLTLATARGTDRGEVLFDIGGLGPIATWSLQRAGDKYANSLLFFGNEGGVVKTFPDQIALYGQRDAYATDPAVTDISISGIPTTTHLNAAADLKLAELAANQPSYQLVLRQGFWEGRSHIDVGDWVGIRLELGADVITAKHRVAEIEVEIDAGGFETVTLTLGKARPSKDPRSRTSSTAKLVRYLRKYESRTGALT